MSVCAVCLIAAGCSVSATADEISAIENFETPVREHENAYLAQFVPDEGITLDGVLDEQIWKDNGTARTFEHASSTQDNPITMTTMSWLGENGVYVAFSVKDSAIYYSADRTASKNTSVEIYLSAFDALEWNGDSFRISVVPTGIDSCTTVMYTYRTKSATLFDTEKLTKTWAQWNKAHIAACRIDGMGIDTNFNEGYDIELFVPYESLGLSEKPTAVKYMTAFYHVESASSTEVSAVWTKCDQNCGTMELSSWLAANNETVMSYSAMRDLLASPDDYMTIDGELNESVWKTENFLSYSYRNSSYGVDARVSTLAHLGEAGVYVAVKVNDGKLYATSARNVKYNTGLEIWIQNADYSAVGERSLQLRLDALGNVSKQTGRNTHSFQESYFVSRSAVKLLGAVSSDGVVATDTAEGFVAEIFVPYEELGISGKPETIAVYPQYIHAGDLENQNNSGNSPLWCFVQPATQTAAKTDSKNAFLYLRDGDFEGSVSFSGGEMTVGDADFSQDGSFVVTATIVKSYAATSSHKVEFEQIGVVGVESADDGAALFYEGEGIYTLTLSREFFVHGAGKYDITLTDSSQEYTLSVYRLDEGITVDGVLDRQEGWNTENFLAYAVGANAYGVSPDVSVSTLVRLGEAGVYIAVAVSDRTLYATPDRNLKFNSGIEIWVQDANNTAVSSNSLELRIDALGNVEKWVGNGSNTFVTGSFTADVAVKLLGADAENGVVATDTAEGFTAEIFLPYDALDLAEKPSQIAVFPQYVHASDLANTASGNSGAWSFFNPASQTTAKTNSHSAFLYFFDNDFASSLALSETSLLIGSDSLTENGEYSVPVTAEKVYAVTASHTKKFKAIPLAGATFTATEGVALTAVSEGEYLLTLDSDFVSALHSSGNAVLSVSVPALNGGRGATASVFAAMPSADFDGVVTEADGYSAPYTFRASNNRDMEVTVYVKSYDYGVSVALVLDSDYINYGNTATGNNGGGFEIRMAASPDAERGLWWRVFADGSVRQESNLKAGAPSAERTDVPAGSSAFAVGLVPNDGNDLSKGYFRMTLEYFVEYSAVGASGADGFYLAIGANATKNDNTTMAVRWMDGSGTTVPAGDNWVRAYDAEHFTMRLTDVYAVNGKGTFKAGATLSEYVYLKGVSFDGASVTEGDFGTYTVSVTEKTTAVTAVRGELDASFTVFNEKEPVLDGAVGADEYEGCLTLSTKGTGKTESDYAAITVSYYVGVDCMYLAFNVTENTAHTLTNTGSGNQGSAGINLAVSTKDFGTANYYRAYASGIARTYIGFNGKPFGAPNALSGSLPYMKGSYTVASGETVADVTHYCIEWKIGYDAYGASSADDLYFLLGWITAGSADRVYDKTTGSFQAVSTNTAGNILHTFDRYISVKEMIALAEQQREADV